ncbi:MAG: GNAT family N-acetyltransferase [Acidobacteria bacterium]|jgi:GNAT superfamily N-acetyltransferase|nr:MAG: GNAT family N-acetyltransferase [Acidobacteriota bacterium]
MSIKIRLAEENDASALVNFNQAMAMETEGKSLSTETLTKGVKAVFQDANKGFYVVAEDEGKVVGCLMITFEWSDWRNGWFWWIQSVYVMPEYRGKGVYRQLYEFVKEKAKKTGSICGFRLYVDRENKIAQQVYKKLGMEESNYIMFEESLW